MDVSETKDYLILLIVGTGVLFTLSVGLILFFVRYQRKILKQQREMHELEQKYNHDLLVTSFKSVEEERKRVAQDLHDDIGSLFSTLKLKLDQINKDYPQVPIQESTTIIQTGIDGVRAISNNLTPYGIEMFGLPTAVEHFCTKINDTGQIKVNFERSENFPELPEDVTISVYRIIQEMISNTIKHADASEISVLMHCKKTHCQISYTDNGKGMDMDTLKRLDGHGLKNTESRLRMIEANYEYKTKPGKGLELTFNIPYKIHEYTQN